MKNLGTVTLETERLILRRPVMDDAEAMLRNWASDPESLNFSHGNLMKTLTSRENTYPSVTVSANTTGL